MKIRKRYTCPLEITHDVIKGKWKPIILWQLKDRESSLSKLEKSIQGINQKMLLQQLKELIDFSLVRKKEFSGYPLKVEYSLTDLGKEMAIILITMQNVGFKILKKGYPPKSR
jgi:DNA-binding HxlR family transcriptional regulator